jgi:hypothetical protein
MAGKKGGSVLERTTTSSKSLSNHCGNSGSVRVGSTINPTGRAGQYAAAGYSGKMIVCPTSNIKSAENKLLSNGTHILNVHSSSNAPAKPGYVYVISGQKSSK